MAPGPRYPKLSYKKMVGPFPAQPFSKCLLLLKEPESRIYLKTLVLPFLVIGDIIDVSETYHVTAAYDQIGNVELDAPYKGKVPFLECILCVIQQVLILVQQDTELRTCLEADQFDRTEAQQQGNTEIVQLAFDIIEAARIDRAELGTCAIIRLVP